jgi:hypothetical protein
MTPQANQENTMNGTSGRELATFELEQVIGGGKRMLAGFGKVQLTRVEGGHGAKVRLSDAPGSVDREPAKDALSDRGQDLAGLIDL